MKIFRDESFAWLCIWTLNNIGVTLLNKISFAFVDFRYPYFLSFVHMVCNSVGAQYVFWSIKRDDKTGSVGRIQNWLGHMVRTDLDKAGRNSIRWFSLIFSLNIAIGNVSLRHVSINFNQVMRSLVPVFAILMGLVVGKKFSARRILSVVPVVVGVAMACYGDMTFTTLGFIYTLSCVVLAALKAVVAGQMLTGATKLHPVDLLGHLAPLAMMQCLFLSIVTGEVSAIFIRPELYLTDPRPMLLVFLSGVCSFTLNITSLMTNKLTSPLTLTIAGNVKQVMMIIISTIIFSTPVSPLNGFGILVVLIGSAIYSIVSLTEKNRNQSLPNRSHSSSNEATNDRRIESSNENELELLNGRPDRAEAGELMGSSHSKKGSSVGN